MVKIRRAKKPQAAVPSALWQLERDGVTQGFLESWMSCRKLADWKFRQGLGPAKQELPLLFGTAAHGIIERVLKNDVDARQIQLYGVETEKAIRAEHPRMDDKTEQAMQLALGMAEALLPIYFQYYDFRQHDWVALEQEFDLPYTYPDGFQVRVRGKIDGLYRLNGRLWLFETKTKGKIDDPNYVDLLNMELQCCLYAWATAQLYGEYPFGVVYNLIRRPLLKQKTGDTLPSFLRRIREDVAERMSFYFIPREVMFTDEDRATFQADFDAIMAEVRAWSDGQLGTYKHTGNCLEVWGACPYLAACSRNDTSGLARRSACFPELARGE